MCDLNTGKRGDIAIINTNVAYNLVERRSTGHIGEGRSGGGERVGAKEDTGEDINEYEVVGISRSNLPSQRTGESSLGREGGGNITPPHSPLAATSTGEGGGEEVVYEVMKGGQ